MRVEFAPSVLSGRVTAPPSKSGLHRLLLCAGLAAGESRIGNAALSEDISATAACLSALGASVRFEHGAFNVQGLGGAPVETAATLPCGECGSTLRFFLPLCMCVPGESRLTGSPRLLERPLSVYEALCRERGISFQNDGAAVTVGGVLGSGAFAVPGDISSQFVSGLLFALPLLQGDSEITLTGKTESRPYIELTLAALRQFGVEAAWKTETSLFIPGGQRYQPRQVTAEGDWSNAAFWCFLRRQGEKLDISGLNENSLQGDRVCVELFDRLAGGFTETDISDCPDLAPVLMAAAAANRGGAFTGVRRLRLKESDRGEAMAAELRKFGIAVTVTENRITVHPGALHAPAVSADGHNDHRIVMALACLLVKTGGVLTGAEAVNKSYPTFFDERAACGAR